MLMGLMIGYLKFHAYPLFAPEALIVVIAVGGIGMLLGLLPAFQGPTNLRAFILGLILLWFLDLQFSSNAEFRNLFSGDHKLPAWAIFTIGIAAGFAAFMAILSMREHIATIFVTVFAVFFLSTLLIPGSSIKFGKEDMATSSGRSSDASLTVHLVLDGHIGIEGIPVDLAGGLETKEALLRFYERWGFRLYGGAYSPYLMTLNSVSSVLNGVVTEKDLLNVENGRRPGRAYRLIENAYFRTVLESGRTIRVFQSDYVDYCDYAQAPVESCHTYPVSSINALAGAEVGAVAKARLILDSFLRRKSISGKFYGSFVERPFYSSVAARDVFIALRDDILANPRGNLFFGHMMLPHDPYVWDQQCRIRPDTRQWMSRRPDHADLTTLGTAEYRKKAYADYFEQVHCVTKLLDALFTSMDEEGLMQDATIIIYGDHGSRITLRDPIIAYRDLATKSDYVDSFSTLFAIRTPGTEPGYSSELRPLPNLFAEHVSRRPAPMGGQNLYLRKDHRVEQRDLMPVTMPAFGPDKRPAN